MYIYLTILFLLLSVFSAHADIYQVVNSDGTVFFTNNAFEKGARIVLKERRGYRQAQKATGIRYVPTNAPAQSDGGSTVFSREFLHGIVEDKSKQHSMDPDLIKAVIRAESNWNPSAVSPKGALGLMQLMPGTASLLGVSNPFDPVENIDGGIRYLKMMLNRFGGNLSLALAAYNAGPKAVERNQSVPSIPETVAYVKRILMNYSGSNPEVAKISTSEIRKSVTKIKRLIQEDGTVLFTNSFFASSVPADQAVR